jgi:hypothetical protein
MLLNKFKIKEVNKYIYVKNIERDYIILCLYVNDMIILDSNDSNDQVY